MTRPRRLADRIAQEGLLALGTGGRMGAPGSYRALERPTATKRVRSPWWPPGVDSEPEMKLYTRLEQNGLPLGEGQYRFVQGRQYRWDRCWPKQMIAVEVQGGVWTQGAHSRGSGVQRDCMKLSLGAALGWRVLPVTPEMIEDGTAIELIGRALDCSGDG